jgi:hypothetical protein
MYLAKFQKNTRTPCVSMATIRRPDTFFQGNMRLCKFSGLGLAQERSLDMTKTGFGNVQNQIGLGHWVEAS